MQVRACRTFPGAAPLCQANWSASFVVGTAVDPRVNPVAFVSDNNPSDQSGTFSWSRWPVGGYEGILYACGNGSPQDIFVDAVTSQGGTCHAALGVLEAPVLTIRVIANGGNSYDISYDRAGNVR